MINYCYMNSKGRSSVMENQVDKKMMSIVADDG